MNDAGYRNVPQTITTGHNIAIAKKGKYSPAMNNYRYSIRSILNS